MSPQAARALLLGLADEALSGRTGEVVCLEAPQWPPLPASLRRQLDGRSVYTRPGTARFATAAQLTVEEQLVVHAQAQGAPRLPGEVAARRLGTNQAVLEAELRGRPHGAHERDPLRGLRLDQAAAVWHVLTSARTVEVVTGPAGTGKTWVLATAAATWDGSVFGTATSQNATNELRAAGVQVAANTTRLLADLAEGRIPPGSLILADEGSMISITHLAAIVSYAAREQLQAGTRRGPRTTRRRGRRRRHDAARGPARLRPACRAGPVHRRLGTRRLAAAPLRGRHRTG